MWVFTFIVGLSALVGAAGYLANRYSIASHRALIQSNLPAAALAQKIATESAYLGSLAPSFARVEDLADLDALSGSLQDGLAQLSADLGAVGTLGPVAAPGEAVPPVGRLAGTIADLSDAAHARIAASSDLNQRLAAASATLDELKEIVSAQTDTARVRITSAIADLYAMTDGARTAMLGQLADEDFFVYDRHVELTGAVDAAGLMLMQLPAAADAAAIARAEAAMADKLALAGERVGYLASPAAQRRTSELLDLLKAERGPGGAFGLRRARLAAESRQEGLLAVVRSDVAALTSYTQGLLDRIQAEARTSLTSQETLNTRLAWGLVALVALAVLSGVYAWRYIRLHIVARLHKVSRHIAALGRGDYAHEIPVTGPDEIGRMERALDVLRQRAAQARQLSQTLEQTVLDRTGAVVAEMQAHDAARAEAEAASRAKTEFLAMMSHEIRTPLNGMIGMLRLLEDDLGEKSAKARATTARVSAEHLLTLTNDILDHADAQTRPLRAEDVHFDPRALVGQLGTLLQGAAQAKGLHVSVDLAPSLPRALLGDVAKIRQVMVNLISNAVKYTDRGDVTLFLDHAHDEARGLHVLSFSVSDTGRGIAHEDLGRIFDLHGRARGAPGQVEGLGLGLSISRRLTEALGGLLTVESEPGVGSRFTLTVPLAEGDFARVAESTETLRPAQFGKSVLLVEDHPVNRLVARGYLERMGCTVREAETGAAALSAAGEGAFDLVLLDIDLPDMPGGDVAAALRARGGAVPPIVALTAHRVADTGPERARLAVDRILHKPVSPRELASVLGAQPTDTAPSQDGAAVSPADDTLATLCADRDEIGAEVTRSIVAEYLADAARTVPGIERAAQSGDADAARRLAHRLKGAAANFRLAELCAQLARIEEAARTGAGTADAAEGLAACEARAAQALRAAAGKAGLGLAVAST